MINPDIPPARILIDKLLEASVRPTLHRYAVARGITRLREAFSVKYKNRFNVAVDHESEVCVTFGSKDAMLCLLMVLASVEPRRRVIVGTPVYPAHSAALEITNFTIAPFEVSNDEEAMLSSIEGLLSKEPTAAVLLNFPHNPTGMQVSESFWSKLVSVCRAYGSYVFNDFVYGELAYREGPAVSALVAGTEKVIEVYSMSKAYSIPGWRIGAALGDPTIVAALSQFKADVDYGTFLPLQHAAADVLTNSGGITEEVCRRYMQRAGVLCAGLAQLGFRVCQPEAGCSVWAELPSNYEPDGTALSLQLLQEEGIAVLPGAAFGAKFKHFLRFALVQDEERLRAVLAALERVLPRL